MNIKDLLKEDSIILDSHAQNKNEVISEMVTRHFECGHIKDKSIYEKAILERESLSSTGVGNAIAIPHAQSQTVNYPSLVALVHQQGIDYDSLDQKPAHLFFMIAVPENGGSQHLEILAQLCQMLMNEELVQQLIHSKNQKDFINILFQEFNQKEEVEEKEKQLDIVAVTACPTGIAHTYMAEKALIDKAKEMGISIKVETNGAKGIDHQLTPKDIEEAKCVIVAADKKVEMKRFQHKYLIQVPVIEAIDHTEELLNKAMKQEAHIYEGEQSEYQVQNENGIRKIYRHLMNGISQIIPILMISGILMSLVPYLQSWDFDSEYTTLIYYIATFAINIAIPIMSAFIADSIGDRPAFIVALVSSIFLINIGGNVIEGILLGFFVGYFILALTLLFSHLPKDLQNLTPHLLLPIIGTLTACALIYLCAPFFVDYITLFNQESTTVILIIIGAILGTMMSVDFGGPVNKTAYTIGIIGIFVGRYDWMSAVMIAGMMPPLVIWLTMLITKIFNNEERKNKWSCLLKGLCFVSEEAIPYVKKYKSLLYYPCIISSAIAGALAMYFQCGQAFPHGGIWTLLLINNPLYFLISLIIALIIGTTLIVVVRKFQK